MIGESTFPQIQLEDSEPGEDATIGPQRLWRETLCLLLKDAMNHHKGGKTPTHAKSYELEQAYDDVVRCGPMLRWCCSWLVVV